MTVVLAHRSAIAPEQLLKFDCYCLRVTGGPLTRVALRLTVTSTRSAIFIRGMPLFIPYCLRSKAMVPWIVPEPVPAPVTVSVSSRLSSLLEWCSSRPPRKCQGRSDESTNGAGYGQCAPRQSSDD